MWDVEKLCLVARQSQEWRNCTHSWVGYITVFCTLDTRMLAIDLGRGSAVQMCTDCVCRLHMYYCSCTKGLIVLVGAAGMKHKSLLLATKFSAPAPLQGNDSLFTSNKLMPSMIVQDI